MPTVKSTPPSLKIDPESIRALLEPLLLAIGRQDGDAVIKRLDEVAQRNQENHKDNQNRRHELANHVQGLTQQQYLIDGRLNTHDTQIRALVGDGAGQGGVLNELKDGQARQGAQLAAIASDMALLKASVTTMNGASADLRGVQNFQAGWKGVAVAIGIASPIVGILGGFLALIWFVFTHMGAR